MSRVYVGNLPIDIRERELEDLFSKYGRIDQVDLKTPSRPPAYAFLLFSDSRDAEDAIRGRDGYDYEGARLRVEMAHGPRDRNRDRDRRRDTGRRSEWRVEISGLPRSASWQDLKDHMRRAGDVVYTDVDGRGGGVVEFSNRSDMEYALRRIDDTEFKNPWDRAYIRVRLPRDSRSRSRSRRRSRSRSRSRDRRRRSHTRSRSRDRGDDREERRSRSPSGGRNEREDRRSNDREDRDDRRSAERQEDGDRRNSDAEPNDAARDDNGNGSDGDARADRRDEEED